MENEEDIDKIIFQRKTNENERIHNIWVRVTKKTYGKVYFTSQRTGASMSLIASMCIEKSLDEVENELKRTGKKIR
jgi:hypothetical protein